MWEIRLFLLLLFHRILSNNEINDVEDGTFDGLENLFEMWVLSRTLDSWPNVLTKTFSNGMQYMNFEFIKLVLEKKRAFSLKTFILFYVR